MRNPKLTFEENNPNIQNLLRAAFAKCYDGQLGDIRHYANRVDMDMHGIDPKPKKRGWREWFFGGASDSLPIEF